MKCPKCQATMVEVREEDVYIDICKECRGVFLDAGELHELLHERSHENQSHHPKEPIYYPQPHPTEYHSQHDKHGYKNKHYHEKEHSHHPYKHYKKKKKKMHHVLGDLFDF